ncbi:uncharacterized protein C8Q71DRAFT_859909 [Rhodofomes roseus]|uniref:C2H2-type domain-containing protein n=1 Tax=Rhodofomes roseus TaxID=34475 RepID=A0ABQ8KAS7_9APHY|nr:uncharacterized protein C8Q71DRAFT_859909 [Rhodofomes roseus]KAH9834249.1 hypothetical protein C8Q71DRAFT_859909 [Rhodofomes roseus]
MDLHSADVQILQLAECQQTASDTWQWTRQYARSGPTKGADQAQATTKELTLLIPGYLIHPLSPHIIELARADEVGDPTRPSGQQGEASEQHTNMESDKSSRVQTTWSYIASVLHDALDVTWDALGSDSEELMVDVAMLPVLETRQLPYMSRRSPTSELTFVVVNLPAHLTVEKKSGSTTVTCFICGKMQTIAQMRNHVGRHLLYALRDISHLKPHKIEQLLNMHVLRAEEEQMKINCEDFNIPDSDYIKFIREELQIEQKRGRGQSKIVKEPHLKAPKAG